MNPSIIAMKWLETHGKKYLRSIHRIYAGDYSHEHDCEVAEMLTERSALPIDPTLIKRWRYRMGMSGKRKWHREGTIRLTGLAKQFQPGSMVVYLLTGERYCVFGVVKHEAGHEEEILCHPPSCKNTIITFSTDEIRLEGGENNVVPKMQK